MSHQVVINYEGIAIQCQSICDVASKQLCKIDRLIETIDNYSSKLLNEQSRRMRESLLVSKKQIIMQLESVISQAQLQSKRGNVSVSSHDTQTPQAANSVLVEAKRLSQLVDDLTTSQIVAYEGLLNRLLSDSVSETSRMVAERSKGNVRYDSDFADFINTISDSVLREFVYIAWLDNTNFGKSNEELLQIGEREMRNRTEQAYKDKKDAIVADIKRDMVEAKLDSATIESVIMDDGEGSVDEQIVALRKKATAEIIGEGVRRQTLRIIIKTIEDKGFIVDRKNIKINKDSNEVVAIAQKASGEKAEFRIFLDGKFIYRFDGYEGQACQKDIQPFMADLEDIYGIKVTSREEIWSNPDKNMTMKHQAINTNKNRK